MFSLGGRRTVGEILRCALDIRTLHADIYLWQNNNNNLHKVISRVISGDRRLVVATAVG